MPACPSFPTPFSDLQVYFDYARLLVELDSLRQAARLEFGRGHACTKTCLGRQLYLYAHNEP